MLIMLSASIIRPLTLKPSISETTKKLAYPFNANILISNMPTSNYVINVKSLMR